LQASELGTAGHAVLIEVTGVLEAVEVGPLASEVEVTGGLGVLEGVEASEVVEDDMAEKPNIRSQLSAEDPI
jgi:hypothetical protein